MPEQPDDNRRHARRMRTVTVHTRPGHRDARLTAEQQAVVNAEIERLSKIVEAELRRRGEWDRCRRGKT